MPISVYAASSQLALKLSERFLFGVSAPDSVVRVLAGENAAGSLGAVAVHYFSFGGVAATSKWAAHAAQGRITLEGDGFTVEP